MAENGGIETFFYIHSGVLEEWDTLFLVLRVFLINAVHLRCFSLGINSKQTGGSLRHDVTGTVLLLSGLVSSILTTSFPLSVVRD